MLFYHCPTGCPASIGKGQVPIEAPSEPWPEPPGGPIRGSLDEEPEDFWEVTFERDFIVATRIHMLRRNRDFQPDPRNMPPGVNATMLESRRQTNLVFVDAGGGYWRMDAFREADAWTGSTTFVAPLRGNVSLRDLGITSLPGERERSRSPRDDNNPDDAGPAHPRIGNTHIRAPSEREVRPRLRALRWLSRKSIVEEKIEEEKKQDDQEEDVHQGGPVLPWELDQYKSPPVLKSKNKDEWDWSQPGWAIRAHGKPRKRKFHPIHREFPLDAKELESRRVTVRLYTGTSPVGIRSIEEDSWTAHQERQRTSQMQQWRGYTFFQIKVGKEKNSGWSSAKGRGIWGPSWTRRLRARRPREAWERCGPGSHISKGEGWRTREDYYTGEHYGGKTSDSIEPSGSRWRWGFGGGIFSFFF